MSIYLCVVRQQFTDISIQWQDCFNFPIRIGCRVQWVWWALPCPWRSAAHISKPPSLHETEWFNGEGSQGSTELGLYIQIPLFKRDWHPVKGWTLQEGPVCECGRIYLLGSWAWSLSQKRLCNFFLWLLSITHLFFFMPPKNKDKKNRQTIPFQHIRLTGSLQLLPKNQNFEVPTQKVT